MHNDLLIMERLSSPAASCIFPSNFTHHDGSVWSRLVGVVVRLAAMVQVVREAADHPLQHGTARRRETLTRRGSECAARSGAGQSCFWKDDRAAVILIKIGCSQQQL